MSRCYLINLKNFDIGEHAADLELRVRGENIKDVFLNAARGMLNYIAPGPGSGPRVHRQIRLKAPGREELLVDWLNEILFLQETEEVIFREFDIRHLTDREIQAALTGEKTTPAAGPEIKAATYHGLYIRKLPSGWEAHVILDL